MSLAVRAPIERQSINGGTGCSPSHSLRLRVCDWHYTYSDPPVVRIYSLFKYKHLENFS